jgi:dihydrofolate synthase/folylpolyglutamate synthase
MIATMTFEESLAYLDKLYHRPIQPAAQVGLRRIAYLLGRLGNPQRTFRAVHVAGSNGKGSTNAMLASILQSAGFRTGQFSSPHLESITERIAVNRARISPCDWERHWRELGPLVEDMTENAPADYGLGRPAYFEVLFAMMALHFAASGVEWAAVETGLGGRFDATNTLDSDVAVITNISLEHTQVLGTTIRKIAAEKAAIIKPGSHAVTTAEDPDALEVIEDSACKVGASLIRAPRDICARSESRSLDGQTLSLQSADTSLRVSLQCPAAYQTGNVAAAYGAALALRSRGVISTDDEIAVGLSTAELPGRFEIASRAPLIILDGAHNPAAARELRRAIDELLPHRQILLVFAAMADKDIPAMAQALGPRASRVVVTGVPGAQRSATVDSVAAAFKPHCASVACAATDGVALHEVLHPGGGNSDSVVTGSMYLVGYVRERLERMAATS